MLIKELKIYLFAGIILCSCNTNDNSLHQALKLAGDNRPELEKVLKHYSQNPYDSLKLEAARFLLQNMPYHYSVSAKNGEQLQKVLTETNTIYRSTNLKRYQYKAIWDSIMAKYNMPASVPTKVSMDIQTLSANYLIDNIEKSFAIWNTSICRNKISFETFCQVLLPYRINNELPDDFKTVIPDEFAQSLKNFNFDTIYNHFIQFNKQIPFSHNLKNDSVLAFILYFSRLVEQKYWKVGPNAKYRIPFSLNTTSYLKGQYGTCKEKVEFKTNALRALGIPATMLAIPNYGNAANSHFFVGVAYTPSIKTYPNNNIVSEFDWMAEIPPSQYYDNSNEPYYLNHLMYGVCPNNNGFLTPFEREFPSEHYIQYVRTVPKVFRVTYSIEKTSLAAQYKNWEMLPPFFRTPYLKDVTTDYLKTTNIEIPVTSKLNSSTIPYLCVFNNTEWTPVDFGNYKKGKAYFKNVGVNCLYLVGTYNGSEIVPISVPFIIDSMGKLSFINPSDTKTETTKLNRKYPYFANVAAHATFLKGAQIQASNNKGFKNYTTLHTINKVPLYGTGIKLNTPSNYRYYRIYYPAWAVFQELAEIKFFNGTKQLEGNYWGGEKTGAGLSRIHDNDILTYAGAEKWIAFNKGNNTDPIDSIMICPRNDKNHIVVGNSYELFYWDNRWISLGNTVADRNYLKFDNAPEKALYLLRCHTEGKEERIFTYKNGYQKFW